MEIALLAASITSIFVFKADKSFDLWFIGTKQGMAWLGIGTGQAGGIKEPFVRNQRGTLSIGDICFESLSKCNCW